MEKKSLMPVDLIIFLPKESFLSPLSKDMEKCEFPSSESRSRKMKFHSYPLVSKTSHRRTGKEKVALILVSILWFILSQLLSPSLQGNEWTK